MPSKGQKVAKRQSEMRSRKRRGPSRPPTQKFEVGPAVSVTNVPNREATQSTADSPVPTLETAAAPSRTRRSKQVVEDAGLTAAASPYLVGELRHIGLVALVTLVALAAAAITLGGIV